MPWLIALLIAGLVGIDQLIKLWTAGTLASSGSVSVIDGVFELVYLENRGAAFGVLQDQRWIVIVLTSVMIGAVCWLLLSNRVPRWSYRVPMILIVAGGLGNLIDRIFRGFVVDMFYFRLIDFAVFNFADACVVVGCIFLLIAVIRAPDSIIWKKDRPKDKLTEE